MTTTEMETMTQGELVSAKTICLVVKVGKFGNSKKASLGPVTVDADKKLLHLSKQLLDAKELVAIERYDRAWQASLKTLAFQSMFKGGIYLLPLGLVESANTIMENAVAGREALIDAACAAYPLRVQETAERLGVTANPNDYPSVSRFRSKFYLEYSYVTFETPSRLKAISAQLFQQERDKAAARLESVAGECQQAMRAGLAELVDHLAQRLTPTEDGKAKRLSTSTVTNLNEWLSMFELRNVTDDSELGVLVTKARAVMTGVDQKVLKSDELIRQKVQSELLAVRAALDPLITEKSRSISFADESEDDRC